MNQEENIEYLDVEYLDVDIKEHKNKINKFLDILSIISLILIPGLIGSIVISTHSTLLINNTLRIIAIILLILTSIILIMKITILTKKKYWNKIYNKNKMLKIFFTIFMIFYIIGTITILTLLYGPNYRFRDWLVTTAMSTMNHQHYCKWFYSDKEIEDVFSRNYLEEPEGSTDESLINVDKDNNEKDNNYYENKYEREIFESHKDELYKIIRFQVNGSNAYLAVIYDPSKIGITVTRNLGVSGEFVVNMAKRENAVLATNGGGFYDPNWSSAGGSPRGITIVNKKIVTNNEYGIAPTTGGLIGFTENNKLVLLKNTTAEEAIAMGVRDAVTWGPFLIVNGKSAYTKGNGGMGGAARTAIGQRADGIVLLLVVDSNETRTKGASMRELTEIMERYGAINATNLDGGTSSVMVENGVLISDPINSKLEHKTRPIATAFIVKE